MTGFDPVRVIDVLARHGLDFVVIGGFAAELYRAPVPPTRDIDMAGDFDVSFRPTGTEGYEDLAVNAVVVEIDDHHVAVAALVDVVRSKEAAGRPKDLAVLAILRRRLQTLTGASLEELRAVVLQSLRRRQDAGADERTQRTEGIPAEARSEPTQAAGRPVPGHYRHPRDR